MSYWFVSRHQGAIDWAKENNIQVDHWVEHLDPALITAGDVVMGTLPLHMAAVVCSKGAHFFHLAIHLNENQRGKELDLHDLNRADCTLTQFFIHQSVGEKIELF